MAPEVQLGQPYSFSCDVWSVGALMITLASKKLPFYSKDVKMRKIRLCLEAFDPERDEHLALLSKPAKSVLYGMLAKEA